jgi:uncharacterized protein YndB with AHSA1/START domain
VTFAGPSCEDETAFATLAAEPRSKVTFEIEPAEPGVRLTVLHEGFEPGSTVLDLITDGWPQLVSDLKTLLETGRTLAQLEPAAV